jgi:hypothetical protein
MLELDGQCGAARSLRFFGLVGAFQKVIDDFSGRPAGFGLDFEHCFIEAS